MKLETTKKCTESLITKYDIKCESFKSVRPLNS